MDLISVVVLKAFHIGCIPGFSGQQQQIILAKEGSMGGEDKAHSLFSCPQALLRAAQSATV